MRDLLPQGLGRYTALVTPSEDSVGWASQYTGTLSKDSLEVSAHIYFGHDAARGLQWHPHATGLDSGCLYGGELSAIVLEEGLEPKLVQVKANRVHQRPSASHPMEYSDTREESWRKGLTVISHALLLVLTIIYSGYSVSRWKKSRLQ